MSSLTHFVSTCFLGQRKRRKGFLRGALPEELQHILCMFTDRTGLTWKVSDLKKGSGLSRANLCQPGKGVRPISQAHHLQKLPKHLLESHLPLDRGLASKVARCRCPVSMGQWFCLVSLTDFFPGCPECPVSSFFFFLQ